MTLARARRAAAVSGLAGLVLVCTLALPATARAAPLVDHTVGGMVFTGPTSAHVSSLWWNPAATGLVRGFHVYFSGQLHADPYRIQRAPIDTGTGEPSDSVQGTRREDFDPASGTLLTPGAFLGFTWDFGQEKFAGGVALHAPFLDVQPSGHQQLRYHTQGGTFGAAYLTFAFSYRFASRWIGGAGLNLGFLRTRLRFSFDEALETCAAAPCNLENPDTTSDFDITTTGYTPNVGFGAGLMWKLRPDLWLALVYQSPPGVGSVSLPGTVTVTRSPQDGGAKVTGDASVNFSLPHTLQLGARWDVLPGRWQLVTSARWIALAATSQIDLRLAGPELREAGVREWVLRYRGLESAFLFEFGIETPAGEITRFGARLRFDTGGVDAAHTAPAQIAGPTFDLAAGVERALGGGFAFTLAASAGLMVPREVGDSAFAPSEQTGCVASGYDLDQCRGARVGSAINTAAGDYQRYNFGVMLGISWETL